MKIGFKAFASILGGMSVIGFSVGFLVGYYISGESQSYLWMYLAAPLLGTGSGLVIYGTLYGREVES
jgi:glycerol uptake facilitator-like aquaporin